MEEGILILKVSGGQSCLAIPKLIIRLSNSRTLPTVFAELVFAIADFSQSISSGTRSSVNFLPKDLERWFW